MRYDPLLYMALYKKKYAYTIIAMEVMTTVQRLWKYMMECMKENNITMSPFLKEFKEREKNEFNGIHFWSNFEIGDLEFYRSEIYEKYMQKLDASKDVSWIIIMNELIFYSFSWNDMRMCLFILLL